MLQIFEQIAQKQSEMAPPDELTQVPPDFPDMVDTFQLPVAYQSPINERRGEQGDVRRVDAFQTATTDTSIVGAIGAARGRGRGAGFTPTRNGWNEPGISRLRQRSDQDDDWRNHKEQSSKGGGAPGEQLQPGTGAGLFGPADTPGMPGIPQQPPKQRVGSESWDKDAGWKSAPAQRRSVPNNASGGNENSRGFWTQNNRNDRWYELGCV